MGDMADAMLENDDPFDEEYDEEAHNMVCLHCGKRGLHWRQHQSGKWWLAEEGNEWHTCQTANEEG